MLKQHHYRRRTGKDPADLDMTTFLNLMVVLVPFLLITAVFSRITIVELSLPSAAVGAVSDPKFRVEVIVREAGLELTNGTVAIASIPKVDGKYDLARLQQLVMSLKRQFPDSNDASVLLEPHIEYDHLIQVMDVVRSAELPATQGEGTQEAAAEGAEIPAEAPEGAPEGAQEGQIRRVALFTDISIGDAP